MATTADDLRMYVLEYAPTIVHFCGHGAGNAGLCLEDSDGNTHLVSGASLAKLFQLVARDVICVVLNACFSEEQGQPISEHIDFVIGMRNAVKDAAALKFAEGFYQAVWAGQPFEQAFKFGCSAIDTAGLPNEETPILLQNSLLSGLSIPYDGHAQEIGNFLRRNRAANESSKPMPSSSQDQVKISQVQREWLWLEDEEETVADIRPVLEREISIKLFRDIPDLTRYLAKFREASEYFSRYIGLILDVMIVGAGAVVRPSQSPGTLPQAFPTNKGYDAGLVYYEKIILGERGMEAGLIYPPPPVIFCSVMHQESEEILSRLINIRERWSECHGVPIAEAKVMFVRKWGLSGELMLDLVRQVDV